MTSVKLKVMEALQEEAYKGIVRIDSQTMHDLGVRPGDIMGIEGARKTVGIVERAYPTDVGQAVIRMDGILRRNAKTSIGEMVLVERVEVKEAKHVVIAPAQQGIMIQADPEYFKRGLIGRAVIKGDQISPGGPQRKTRFEGDELLGMFSSSFSLGLTGLKFIVVSTEPKNAVIITENTEMTLNSKSVEVTDEKIIEVTYEDIGGLTDEVKKIREMVELPLKHPEIFDKLGIQAPKGVLLYGPPGTGKTLLAKAVANETNAHFIHLDGPSIMSKFVGEAEKKVRDIFEEAEKSAPSIIFIDEIDAIAPKREESYGEVERRVVAQILAVMDGLKSRGRVVVIAATNRPNSLDPALRRPGRFDREIELGVPKPAARLEVFKIHTRNMPLIPPLKKFYLKKRISLLKDQLNKVSEEIKKVNDKDKIIDIEKNKKNIEDNINRLNLIESFFSEDETKNFVTYNTFTVDQKETINKILLEEMLEELARVTHGFVGADLEVLCKEAAMVVLRKNLSDLHYNKDEPIPKELLEKLIVGMDDFKEALKMVRPSAMREVFVETPTTTWDDIGGLEDVKVEVKEAVEMPLKNPAVFKKMGVRPPRGVLLYGPPGTGKTLLAKAVAHESEANFILVNGPELLSKWVGESERGVRKIFEKARQASPAIIFFDEIDSIVPRRGHNGDTSVTERMVNQLLTEIDGLQELNDVVVIGATNRPDIMDPALLRPGRFDRLVFVPVPDAKSRLKIFEIHSKGMPLAKDVVLKTLADKAINYVGADVESVCREAAMLALRKDINITEVSQKDFLEAMKKVKPSIDKESVAKYESIGEDMATARADEIRSKKDVMSYMG